MSGGNGWVVLVHGGRQDQEILERFLFVAGADAADILVIPTASAHKGTGELHAEAFRELGATRVEVMDFDTRRDCHERGRLKRIAQATGIFFTEGSALRLAALIGGTPVAKAIGERHAAGAALGGAGDAACALPEHRVSGERTRVAPGLGLLRGLVIEPHGSGPDRLGRMLGALACDASMLGLGLEGKAAAILSPEGTLEVVGHGSVSIVDASVVTHSSVGGENGEGPVCMLGLRMHLLVEGTTFDLRTRHASAGALTRRREA